MTLNNSRRIFTHRLIFDPIVDVFEIHVSARCNVQALNKQ